jgi:Fibronectin type III domain
LGCSSPPPPTTVPAAPTGLAASVLSSTEVQLTWTDNANNEDEYRVELRILPSGQFVDIGGVAANSTEATVTGLTPATGYGFRVRARRATTNSAYSNEVNLTTASNTSDCISSATVLCIDDAPGDRRFEVRLVFQDNGQTREAKAIPLASLGVARGGLFWFFSADNPELLIKVLNGCGLTSSYWVFYSAGTNVGFSLSVRDTVTGKFKVYNNPNGVAAPPVQDTGGTFSCS